MKPKEVEEQLRRLHRMIKALTFNLTIISAKVEALTNELADALRRQGVDPKPFLRRLHDRSMTDVRKTVSQKEGFESGLKKLGYKDPLEE